MDRRTHQRSLLPVPAEPRTGFAVYLLAVALVLVPALALATSEALLKRAQHPDRRVSIFEADRTIDRVIDGERVTYLLGHVFIDRDSLTARSDTAVYYRDRDFYEFHGNVEFTRLGGVPRLPVRHLRPQHRRRRLLPRRTDGRG